MIGTLSAAQNGRQGVVVDARPVGEPRDGRQLTALRLQTVDGKNVLGQAAARASGLAPLPTEASERSQANRPLRTTERSTSGQPASPGASRSGARGPVLISRRPDQLSPAEQTAVQRLQQRDQQVRQEESAHAAVAGDLPGPIEYVYARGPDGRQYAVGGSVGIEARAQSGDPAERARLGGRIQATAAAVNPSAQDQAAARQGLRLYAERADLAGDAGAEGQSSPPRKHSSGTALDLTT